MHEFSLWWVLAGGLLLGLSCASVLLLQGHIAGVSGIVAQLLQPERGETGWRAGFVLGLLVVGALGVWIAPAAFSTAGAPSLAVLAGAGLLVGIGTRLGDGCTSGHGVCGVSRLSRRSIVATATFFSVGIATVFVIRHLLGGG